jgi:hypothetical protein
MNIVEHIQERRQKIVVVFRRDKNIGMAAETLALQRFVCSC